MLLWVMGLERGIDNYRNISVRVNRKMQAKDFVSLLLVFGLGESSIRGPLVLTTSLLDMFIERRGPTTSGATNFFHSGVVIEGLAISRTSTRIDDNKLQVVLSGMKSLKRMLQVTTVFTHHTTNGSQFTMSYPHQELASPDQTVSGKDSSNPLIADNLPKIIWYSTHHVTLMKSWLVQKQTALGQTTTGKEISNPFMAVLDHSWCQEGNDVIRLQALVDKKKVVVTEATIREALRLEDADGVECLSNEEIFAELARMGYEKPSTKLTFYKALFSSQWKFLIHTILQCMSAKRTSWNKFSSSMASAVICLSSGRKFNFSKYIFDSLEVAEEGDAEVHGEEVNAGDAAEGDVSAAHGEVSTVAEEPSIPSPTAPTQPLQPSQDISSTSQRVKKLEMRNKVRVLKLRRLQKVGTTQRVETSDETVMDDVSNQGRKIAEMDQDADVVQKDDREAEIYKTDLDDANKVLSMHDDESEPAEVQKVVDVVTTAKIITEVVIAANETITAASTIITAAEAQVPAATLTVAPARVTAAPSRRRKGVVIRDLQEESTTSTIIPAATKSKDKGKGILAELNKNIDWDEAIDHVKRKAKKDPAVKRYQMDYFKGMSYDDIRPIFEAKFNTNVAFLLETKEQIEEDKNRALKRLNETPAERAVKRQKLDEEVEELKRHLQIVPNEDDDVYTKATLLARKVPVVDYQIIEMNNKPYYKIIRADDTHQLYSCSNLEESMKCTWFNKDQRMEAIGIMWSRDTSCHRNKKTPKCSPPYMDLGDCDRQCRHCRCLFWYNERLKGHQYGGQAEYHLCCENIRAYNQMFVMKSFGAKVDDSIDMETGPYVFKISDNEVNNRIQIVEGLIHVFDEHNGLVKLFRTTRDRCGACQIPGFKIRLYNMGGMRGYELPTSDILGGIVFESVPRSRTDFDVIIEFKGGPPKRINKLHRSYMSLQFPLLFVFGEPGFYQELRLKPRNDRGQGKKDFIRKRQKDLRSDYLSGLYDVFSRGDREGITVGSVIPLPSTFTGVPRILEQKVKDFVKFLKEVKTFGYVTAVMCTVEFQKRGLPYCHTLLWVDSKNKIQDASQIDEYISADLPDPVKDPRGYKKGCKSPIEVRTVKDEILPTYRAACEALDISDKKGAGKQELITTSIAESHLWWHFKICLLTINMRLLRSDLNDEEQRRSDTTGMSELIDFIYDETMLKTPTTCALQEKAIVCPKNDTVDAVNAKMLSLIEGQSRTYLSKDEVIPQGKETSETKMLYPMEYLNTITFLGFPPHELHLMVGSPIMLLRNVNLSASLCNGTRMIVTPLMSKLIEARIITGTRDDDKVFIHRILLMHKDPTFHSPSNVQGWPKPFINAQRTCQPVYVMVQG
nr:helitron helicase-like domain-containing protein [Tanacetum cinerariifolium]